MIGNYITMEEEDDLQKLGATIMGKETLEDNSMQKLVEDNFDRLPSCLKGKFYDVLIIAADEDQEAAKLYEEHLHGARLPNDRGIDAVLYNDPELNFLSGGVLDILTVLTEYYCTFVFIIVTQNLKQSHLYKMLASSVIWRQLLENGEDIRVCPVYLQNPRNLDSDVTCDFAGLSPQDYYKMQMGSDVANTYHENLVKLVYAKENFRKNMIKELMKERYAAICENLNN